MTTSQSFSTQIRHPTLQSKSGLVKNTIFCKSLFTRPHTNQKTSLSVVPKATPDLCHTLYCKGRALSASQKALTWNWINLRDLLEEIAWDILIWLWVIDLPSMQIQSKMKQKIMPLIRPGQVGHSRKEYDSSGDDPGGQDVLGLRYREVNENEDAGQGDRHVLDHVEGDSRPDNYQVWSLTAFSDSLQNLIAFGFYRTSVFAVARSSRFPKTFHHFAKNNDYKTFKYSPWKMWVSDQTWAWQFCLSRTRRLAPTKWRTPPWWSRTQLAGSGPQGSIWSGTPPWQTSTAC